MNEKVQELLDSVQRTACTFSDAAVDAAYGLAERIQFHNAFYRRDIGRRALEALRGER